MKFVVSSDLHIHKFKQSYGKDRLKLGLDALEVIFRKASELDNVILMAGDLFHVVPLNPEVVNETVRFFNRMKYFYPSVVMYGISGNHDISVNFTPDANGVSALTMLHDSCSNFNLIDGENIKLGVDNRHREIWVTGIPYFKYKEHFMECLDRNWMAAELDKSYLLTHQTPEGVIDLDVDFSPNDPALAKYARVFNGHIHIHKDLGKVISVGNHVHLDKSDIGKPSGYLIYDTDTDTYTQESLMNQFPQIIVRPEGAELNEWESQQMVIWESVLLSAQVGASSQFTANASPQELVEKYITHAEVDEATARVGRAIVESLKTSSNG